MAEGATRAKVIDIPCGWVPRPDQRTLWDYLEWGGKRAVMVAHRRWGKDDVALHFTATQMIERPGNYWHMLPQYNQARKVIWDAINPKTGKRRIDEAFPREIRRKIHEQEMFIEFANGATWQLVGSDHYDSLVGSSPVGIVFSEYAVADPMAWAYLRPILAANDGWALFIYTPRGANHGKSLYDFARTEPGWFATLLPADRTPVFTPDRLDQERRELLAEFGETEGEMLFICEELLPGVEPGIDGATWEGELIYPTTCGYEHRGSGIISRVYQSERDLPEPVKWINDGLSPEFKRHKTRFFYSTEFKIGKDKTPYLIDPTIRLAAPGVAAIQTELIENYSEVIYGMATGERVAPVMKYKYAAAASMESSEAAKTFVNITFPKEMRRWVKLRMAVHKGHDYYSVPPFDSLGVVIALGESVKEVMDLVKERIKQVDAISISTDLAGLDKIFEDIQTGKQYGINF